MKILSIEPVRGSHHLHWFFRFCFTNLLQNLTEIRLLCFICLCLCFSVIELTTCNARGKDGPTPDDCDVAYNNTEAGSVIQVINDQPYRGVQVWKVPSENYYT